MALTQRPPHVAILRQSIVMIWAKDIVRDQHSHMSDIKHQLCIELPFRAAGVGNSDTRIVLQEQNAAGVGQWRQWRHHQ